MRAHHDFPKLIENLAGRRSEMPLVSLYLQTSPQPDRLQQNEIRLKTLLRGAREQLQQLGVAAERIDALDKGIWETAEQWRDGSGLLAGLALFAEGEDVQTIPLPYEVEDLALVGSRFHLKPLIRGLEFDRPFSLLALSQNQVSLFSGDAISLQELDLSAKVPKSLQDVKGHQPAGKTLHYHAGARAMEVAKFHGHGAGKDDIGPEIESFLDELDSALKPLFELSGDPVVLAGVESLLATYRSVSRCETLLEKQIEGNVKDLSEQQLHARAWPLIAESVAEEKLARFRGLVDSGARDPVARKLPDVLRAAADGRVETVFVASDVMRWGSVDDSDRSVSIHEEYSPGDLDLLDRAAVESHVNGGKAQVITRDAFPGESVALARLRY